MVHRPKSVMGFVFLLLVALGVAYVAVTLIDKFSGPWLVGVLAVIVVASLLVFIRRRRVDAARERAWTGSFSFASVVARRHEEETLRRAETSG
jgi:hypothetical protein